MAADVLNLVSNLAIVGGYLLVPSTVLPFLRLPAPVLISGTLFFLTCAFTHATIAFGVHDMHAWWMVTNHVVQAASVIAFVLGFGRVLRLAHRRAEEMTPTEREGL